MFFFVSIASSTEVNLFVYTFLSNRHRVVNLFIQGYNKSWVSAEEHGLEEKLIEDLAVCEKVCNGVMRNLKWFHRSLNYGSTVGILPHSIIIMLFIHRCLSAQIPTSLCFMTALCVFVCVSRQAMRYKWVTTFFWGRGCRTEALEICASLRRRTTLTLKMVSNQSIHSCSLLRSSVDLPSWKEGVHSLFKISHSRNLSWMYLLVKLNTKKSVTVTVSRFLLSCSDCKNFVSVFQWFYLSEKCHPRSNAYHCTVCSKRLIAFRRAAEICSTRSVIVSLRNGKHALLLTAPRRRYYWCDSLSGSRTWNQIFFPHPCKDIRAGRVSSLVCSL